MIRFYSIFVTDTNLLSSPDLRFNLFHDINLERGTEETVNFLLQTPLTLSQCRKLKVICDPHQVTITDVEVKTYKHQSLVSVTLVPKEIGSLRVGIAFPQSEPLHEERLQQLPSQLVSVPCAKIHLASKMQYQPKLSRVQS